MNAEEKILESALKIFVTKGFTASTGEITQNAGVSTGLLFHYFPTKNDLIITLYERCLLENFRAWLNTFLNFDKTDLREFKKLVRIGWEKSVNWGLENWNKFQYIQLFDGSLIAGQFTFNQHEEIKKLYQAFQNVSQYASEHHYLKEIPSPFRIEISRSVIATTTSFLHKYPEHQQDKYFMERSWEIYLTAVGG
ncbi:MAG: TetR/AcrR family transcriptional regulator [Chloroflexi bacterium]|nr:TetR/AcrR family transcriptional regulator [Chloroflexota bacterium]